MTYYQGIVESEEQRQQRLMLANREKELDELRKQLVEREAYIENRTQQEKKLLEQREKELYESVETRNQSFLQHEQAAMQRQNLAEKEIAEHRAQLAEERKKASVQRYHLDQLRVELESEKQRLTEEGQKTLQDNSKRFVGSALSLLGAKESRFHFISGVWGVIGAIALISGVAIAIATMISSSDNYHQVPGAGLAYYFFHLFRGLVVVGLCGVLSRYAFVFSKSYMHESLKIGERAHAIRFGEFYLDTYGANAQWNEVKEAFAHWNISGQNAFTGTDASPVDPSVVEAAGKLAEKAMEAATNFTKNPSST
ncbi:hypothetical protein [Pseudomonas salomonii]|uniref:Uncharacterized protein n=1 Tax=Pseudomonas salomonii TaxID=191391 RepID=A0ABS9GI19_9PSED|nr:hypothetical protein [Pseudomonas salomonii]MCF5545385.1 hypothetical protein [Pseudomonas salomonii]